MRTVNRDRLDTMRDKSHVRYVEALEFPNVIPAIRRIVELQPLKDDKSLLNEDNRIEYCALLSLVHAVVQNDKRGLAIRALSIWLDFRQSALTTITFDNGGYHTIADQEHERTLSSLLRAHAEQQARDNDAKTFALAVALMNRGTLESAATVTHHNEGRQQQIEREKPIDVQAIIARVTASSK